jgi:hypothetical protein
MATASTHLRETIEFDVNVPVEVALKFPAGKIISTRNGERVMYTLADERVMFLDLGPAQKINDLRVNVREKFLVCKRRKGKEPVEWDVWLHPETEKARAIAEARRDGSDPELVGKLYDSMQRVGSQKDGTFVVPVVPGASAGTPAPVPSASTNQPSHSQNTSARSPLATDAIALVDAFADVLEYSLSTYGGRVKPDDLRSLLLAVYIGRQKAGGRA